MHKISFRKNMLNNLVKTLNLQKIKESNKVKKLNNKIYRIIRNK